MPIYLFMFIFFVHERKEVNFVFFRIISHFLACPYFNMSYTEGHKDKLDKDKRSSKIFAYLGRLNKKIA